MKFNSLSKLTLIFCQRRIKGISDRSSGLFFKLCDLLAEFQSVLQPARSSESALLHLIQVLKDIQEVIFIERDCPLAFHIYMHGDRKEIKS